MIEDRHNMAHGKNVSHECFNQSTEASRISGLDEINAVTARQDGPITLRLNARSGMKLTLLGPKAQVQQGAYTRITAYSKGQSFF